MKKFFSAVVLSVGLLFAAGTVSAADYDYAGLTYSATDYDNRSGDRGALEVSKSLTDTFYVVGGYSTGFDRDFGAGVVSVGVGAHNTITDAGNLDLYGQVTGLVVVNDRADYSKYNYEFEVGLRHQLTDKFEVRTAAIATNLRDRRFEDVKYFGAVTAEYALTDAWRLSVGYVGSRGYNEGNVGVRWYF